MSDCWEWIKRRGPIGCSTFGLKNKKAGNEARSKAGVWPGAEHKAFPSDLADYVGEYEHPAYGILKIGLKDNHAAV